MQRNSQNKNNGTKLGAIIFIHNESKNITYILTGT